MRGCERDSAYERFKSMQTLTILPTAISAEDWTKAKLRDSGRAALFGYPAVSLSQFVRMVARSVHPGQMWLTDGESLAALAGVVDEFYSSRPAAPFYGLRRRVGFWRSLLRFMNECRRACVGKGELEILLKESVGADRAAMLGELHDAYTRRIEELSAIDAAGAEFSLAGTLKSSFSQIPFLAEVGEIEIRGVYDIKPATFEWILELSRHKPTTIFLPLPKDHPRSIRWLEWTYRKFEYLGEEAPAGLTVQSEDLQNNRVLSELLPRLFQPLAQLKEQQLAPLGSDGETLPLRILAANDPRKEMLEIARQVKTLWLKGADLSRVAVLFRRPEIYSNALDAFGAFEVPVEVSPELRAEWQPDPVSREALDLACLGTNGFQREDLLGWIGRTRNLLPDAFQDPDLGRIFRESRLIRGSPAKLAGQLEKYAGTVHDRNLGERMETLAAALKDTFREAGRLAEPATPSRYVRTLESALESLGSMDLQEKIFRLEKILSPWNTKLDPEILYDLLSASLSADGAAHSGGGVRLLSVHDVAGIDIDHLFIAGLTTGAFPEEPKQEVFLKDRERQEISANFSKRYREKWGNQLAGRRPFDTAREERLRENFLFFLCLAQPAGSVTLSYPKLDSQGRPATPSPYIDEIFKQFARPADLMLKEEEGSPQTRTELETQAIRSISGDHPSILAVDADRLIWIARQTDIERRREQFYLERDRDRRKTLAFEYTGRLTARGPQFWRKENMSVRALESFAGCPFKGFAGEIAAIRDVDRPVEGLSPKDMGSLLHKFLEIFWKELKRAYDGQPKETAAVLQTARRFAPEALDAAAKQMAQLGAEGPLWESQKSALRYLMESILDREEESLKAGYWPEEIEQPVSFEIDAGSSAPPKNFIGRIDRVDIGPAGRIRIVDYKLADVGFLRDKKKKLGVTEMQLPAYAMAAVDRLARSSKEPPEVVLAYISLRHAAQPLEVWSGPADHLKTIFNPARILDMVRGGRFDVTPEDETLCEHCDLRRACRIREVLSAGGEPKEES